jgi:hypothetical protein
MAARERSGSKGKILRKKIVCTHSVCIVVPREARVSKKDRDQVEWHAVNTRATIRFPTKFPFGWERKDIPKGGRRNSGPVKNCAPGEYEYSVYCTECGKANKRFFAVAGSMPKMIVDP